MYKTIIRPILFKFQPETIHAFTFSFLKIASFVPGVPFIIRKIFQTNNPKLKRSVFGIDFPNPVGLAAGLDKDADVFDMLGYLGFGFVEIGTLTPEAQPGNPKPRAFRLKKDQALINRMGFNNKGLKSAIEKLKRKKSKIIIGGNIGKNKLTQNENAVNDYEKGFENLYPYVDYFVVNVSSPNTPNLRELQEKEPLTKLLNKLQSLNNRKSTPKPILLKIAPDLSNDQLDDIIEIILETKTSGIIATNTTISREGLSYPKNEIEKIGNGGLSGKPLKERSTEIIKYIVEKSNNAFPVIGVGGIMTADDAIEKLKAGASLIQLYTGFIYEGPRLIKEIKELLQN
ncbi:MAG: dihydroorotate dehydrogenase (quinone) [Bacteroidetes bacterium 4572_117]|nr:MAG: dihydroorotate dehydrogenase (quinone) [Bacteroidetes bacterium 4572_117]